MRKRPWEIVVLTWIYAAAPAANLAFTCLLRGYDLTAVPALALALGPLDWAGLLVCPALAWAVWSVSLAGWWIFLGLNLGLLGLNIYQGSLVPGANLALVAGADVLNIAAAALLFLPHARSPYFSPRSRWWNTEVRYRVVTVLDVPVLLRRDGAEAQGSLLDVSKTGCFVELPPGFSLGDVVDLEFACWGLTIRSRGRILRRSGPDEELQGYGVRFLGLTGTQRHHLQSLVRTLKAHRVPSREELVILRERPDQIPPGSQGPASGTVSG